MEKKVKEAAATEAKAKGTAPVQLTDIILMLQKLLYGLVQSSHLFRQKQSKTMMEVLKLDQSTADYCLYYKWIGNKLFLSVSWVDDMIMACANLSIVKGMKKSLTQTFEIDDVGPMKEFIGCKIEYDQAAAHMSFTQPILIQSFNDEFALPTKRTGGTPAAPGTILQAYENEPNVVP
jgi:Reverse transcriptase (RNA-dependent DNA polymerase)